MAEFRVKYVLCDIEGTITSISFVKDVLFPYATANCKRFLEDNSHNPEVSASLKELLQTEEFQIYRETHLGNKESLSAIDHADFINYLIAKDLKVKPMKDIQGMLWEEGYKKNHFTSHLFPDVPKSFESWRSKGIKIGIYSSGSVMAQKLLLAYSCFGDLTPVISNYFDTSVGHKQQADSYERITRELNQSASDILFLTDVAKEANAAKLAGMHTALLSRPGNAALTDDDKLSHPVVESLSDLDIKPQ